MSNPNRLKPKYAQMSCTSVTKLPSNDTPVANQGTKNPFVKSAMNLDSTMETPQLPRQMTSNNLTSNLSNLKTLNSSNEFVRLTTEVFPNLSTHVNVHFPVACLIKPFGPNVA